MSTTTQTIINNDKMFSNGQKISKRLNDTSKLTNGFKAHKTPELSTHPKNLEDQFKAACETIQNLPKNGPFQPSNEMLLKFYGYFKQATCGPCKSSRPGIFKVVERAKYDAWNSVRHLNKEQAMQGYIDEIKKIVETMPHNDFVQKLINIIGPFYEFVDDKNELIANPDVKEQSLEDNSNDEEDDDDEEESEDKESVIENKNYILEKNSPIVSSTLTTSYENIDQTMLNSFNSETINGLSNGNHNMEILVNSSDQNSKILLKPVEDHAVLNQNGHVNGKIHYEKINGFVHSSNEITSDDEEDFCDTSDYINEQDLYIQRIKKQNQSSDDLEPYHNRDYNHNNILNKLNGNGYSNRADSNFNRANQEVKNILKNSRNPEYAGDKQNKFSPIVHKYGGELNSPPGNLPVGSHNQSRFSRPGSSQSMGYSSNRFNQGAGHGHSHGASGGGMGGGGGSGNENFIVQDTNRQILLILLRLQQDTSNVLTRLSYLESSVLSLQSTRYENGLQINNQGPSAFSVVSPSQNRASSRSSTYGFLVDLFKSIDWKTVAIAIIWPFVIRLVFYFLKKVRLVIKFRKAK